MILKWVIILFLVMCSFITEFPSVHFSSTSPLLINLSLILIILVMYLKEMREYPKPNCVHPVSDGIAGKKLYEKSN